MRYLAVCPSCRPDGLYLLTASARLWVPTYAAQLQGTLDGVSNTVQLELACPTLHSARHGRSPHRRRVRCLNGMAQSQIVGAMQVVATDGQQCAPSPIVTSEK